MKLNYFIIVITLLTVSISCNDNTLNPQLKGIYKGTFIVEYKDGTVFSNPVTVQFLDETFSSSIGANRFPAGGSGEFVIRNNSIEFIDENIWTADFDWNLILSGNYEYDISESKLILSANKNNVGFYKYELIKD